MPLGRHARPLVRPTGRPSERALGCEKSAKPAAARVNSAPRAPHRSPSLECRRSFELNIFACHVGTASWLRRRDANQPAGLVARPAARALRPSPSSSGRSARDTSGPAQRVPPAARILVRAPPEPPARRHYNAIELEAGRPGIQATHSRARSLRSRSRQRDPTPPRPTKMTPPTARERICPALHEPAAKMTLAMSHLAGGPFRLMRSKLDRSERSLQPAVLMRQCRPSVLPIPISLSRWPTHRCSSASLSRAHQLCVCVLVCVA
jgi:hypothetical protein